MIIGVWMVIFEYLVLAIKYFMELCNRYDHFLNFVYYAFPEHKPVIQKLNYVNQITEITSKLCFVLIIY